MQNKNLLPPLVIRHAIQLLLLPQILHRRRRSPLRAVQAVEHHHVLVPQRPHQLGHLPLQLLRGNVDASLDVPAFVVCVPHVDDGDARGTSLLAFLAQELCELVGG